MSETAEHEYTRATGMVLEGLSASLELVRSDRRAEAVERVRGMRAAVQGLHGAAATARQGAASEAGVAQQQLEAMEINIAQLREQETAVRAQLVEVESRVAAQHERAGRTRSSVEALRRELAHLREQVAELHRRSEELSQWFWVPGYGAYLAVRSLAEDDQNRLRARMEEMERLESAEIDDGRVLAEVSAALAHLSADGERLRAHHAELAGLRGQVEQRKRDAARRVAFLLRVKGFYSAVLQHIADIERRLDDVKMMHELLANACDEGARLEDSLLRFARTLDEGGALRLAA